MSEIKDYAVQIKVQNNFLLQRMRAAGFETAAALAKASGVNQSSIGRLLSLKISGLNAREHWRPQIVKICECLRCLPEDIIPEQHHRSALAKNTSELSLTREDVEGLLLSGNARDYAADASLNRSEMSAVVSGALQALHPRQERVLRLLYGFDGEPKTLEEVGAEFSVTGPRIRQIEQAALRRLRHPTRSKGLIEMLRDVPE